MLHNDPTVLLPILLGIIFFIPWSIYGSIILRSLRYARSRGISLLSHDASAQMKALRRTDAHAASLHRRARRWLIITAATWFITFGAVFITLLLLYRHGVISRASALPNDALQAMPRLAALFFLPKCAAHLNFGLTSARRMIAATEQSKIRIILRGAVLSLTVLGLIAGVLVGGFRAYWWRYEHARAVWKTAALQRLAGLSITNEDIQRELRELKTSPRDGDYERWTGEQVALMTNGEYIIYAFWHGANSGFVDHLFLGHCSDGRWLYSTYHFCNRMAGAELNPPGSINEFAATYSAREFDGRSDVCLKHTWPLTRR